MALEIPSLALNKSKLSLAGSLGIIDNVLKIPSNSGTLILNLHDIGCRNRCVFCGKHTDYASKKRSDAIARRELKKLELLNNKKLDISQIIISGNDPMGYYNFTGFLKEIKKRTSINIFLQSHCIDFENISYLKKVIAVGNINKIQVPLYGHTAKIHDSVTRNSGSFNSIIKALGNFKKIGFDEIQVNTLFLKQNENYLLPFFSFLISLGHTIDASLPCIPSFKGVYFQNSAKYIPDVDKVKLFFEKLKKIGKGASLLRLHDIPFCLAPGIKNVSFRSELSYKGYDHFKNKPIDTEIIRGEIIAAYRILAKDKKCRSCILNKACEGITKPYIDLGLFKAKPQINKKFA